MNKWSVRLIHDRRKKATKTVEQPVEIKVYFNRNDRVFIPTGVKLCAGQWDKDRQIAVRHLNQRRINNTLANLKKKYVEVLETMCMNGGYVDKHSFLIMSGLQQQEKEPTFLEFCYNEMDKRNLRESTRRAHCIALEALRRSNCIRAFEDLTAANIRKFDNFLREEDPTREQTTIHGYHKRIKPYINEALRLEYIQDTPYRVFRDRHGRHKERIPLNDEELDMIRNVELHDRQLCKVRDQFVFCCYTGLAWADLDAFSYEDHVVTRKGRSYIDGERLKTGSKFFTPVLPPAMKILEKYDYQFRVPPVQSFNRSLKIIAEIAGVKKHVTSHIARHTFATTVILEHDVPIEALAKMLGHKQIRVTQVYAKILNTAVERQSEKLFNML